MNRFADVLQQARDRLQVPEPSRTRILLEMSSDLEDSYQYFLEEGLDETEAARRAEEAFGTSEDALRSLTRLHQTGAGGFADRLSSLVGTVWERILLVAILLFEMWLAVEFLSSDWFFFYVSPFVWPLAGVAAAAFSVTLWKLYQIFSKRGTEVRRLRTGLEALLFLAGASLAICGCGFFVHLQRFFRVNAPLAPESLFMNFAGWMIQISSMMTVGLLTAILTALVWFVLTNLVARAERAEVDELLAGKS